MKQQVYEMKFTLYVYICIKILVIIVCLRENPDSCSVLVVEFWSPNGENKKLFIFSKLCSKSCFV